MKPAVLQWVNRAGIHVRLLLAGVFLISATTFVLGYMGVRTVNESLQTRFSERITFLSKYLAMNAELGILIDEKTLLKRLALSVLDERDIARVEILNSLHEVLADEANPIPGPYATVEKNVILRELGDENDAFQAGIMKEADPVVGRVRITYSTGGINDLLVTMTTRFVFLSVGLALVSMLIFFVISHSIVAPVSRLANAAREVSYGDYEIRVAPGNLPETKELANAFNEMLDSIENSRHSLREAYRRMTRQKTLAEVGKFSMVIAHEVKNPLAIIRSSFDILKRQLQIPEDNLMMAYIDDEMVRLNRLIEDFLLFSRPTDPRFSRTDLNDMLQDVVGRFAIQNDAAVIDFRVEIPESTAWCNADPDLLSRALGNIIKNACEAVGDGGVIGIRVMEDEKDWKLTVSDTGPGLDSEHLGRLFEPFYTTKSKGTGLGLAFVSQVIKAHGGRVSADNQGEGGAVFTVELPKTKDHDGEAGPMEG